MARMAYKDPGTVTAMSRSFLARGEEEGPATAGGAASRGAQQTLYGTLRTGDGQRRYLPRGRITLTFGSVGSQPALLTERHTRAHDTRVPNDAKHRHSDAESHLRH